MNENKKLNKKNISFVVLVGGLGSRIKHIYPNIPKPLISFQNKPFLYWLIKEIENLHFENVIYASGYKSQQIENRVSNNEFKNLNQKIVKEKKKLGTAGAIFNLLDMCRDNLIILNGDSFLVGGIKKLVETINLKNSCTLVCHHMKNTSRFGRIVFNQKNQLIDFLEKEKSGPGYINSGIYFFKKKKIIEYKTNGYMSLENQLIPNMIKNNEEINIIKIHKPKFFDIGTEDSILESKKNAKQILSNV